MKRYILIGGIGSGKSTASMLFFERGAFCIDLDTIGHRVLLQREVRDALVEAFGKNILDERGKVDRAKLASLAFASPEATAQLNAITHPAILETATTRLDRAERAGSTLAIIETSAFNGEGSPFLQLCKENGGIIAVCAPEDVRIARCVARGMDEADARLRMQRQPTDDERRAWADYVLENSGTPAELEEQIERTGITSHF